MPKTKIPVTSEDFAEIGARYLTPDLLAEINRLLPLAAADISLLALRDYGPDQLAQLEALRASLVAESAGQKQQRGAKKGSRKVEIEGVQDGRRVLRSGIAAARAALIKRKPPKGESVEQTRKIVTEAADQIDALTGPIGNDSAKLETRLTSLLSVLALPALAPAKPAEAKARADFVSKIQNVIKALPDLSAQKKGSQQDAKQGTMSLDEIDGRAYTNLKMLAEVGRAYWNEHKNKQRAAEYQLNNLHPRSTKKNPPGGGGAPPP